MSDSTPQLDVAALRKALDERNRERTHYENCYLASNHRDCAIFALLDALDAANERAGKMADAAEMLWVVLANVSGGDWDKQGKEWKDAAERWRDQYFAAKSALKGTP